jgi:peptide/nickel transport system permease protein
VRALRRSPPRRRVLFAIAIAAGLALVALAPGGGLYALPSSLPMQPPGLAHALGTDDLGRDMLLAIAQGARTSLLVGTGVTATALALGIGIGLAAGLGSRLTDEVLMRSADAVASLPTLVIAILVASLFGGSITALVAVMGLTRWPIVARLVRVEARSLRTREFVLATHALGASRFYVATRHILPHAATAALAATGILFGGALVSEAALAFVGLGDPSVTSLGQLAANGFAFVSHAPWMWAAPTAAIVLLTLGVTAAADRSLRPASAGVD